MDGVKRERQTKCASWMVLLGVFGILGNCWNMGLCDYCALPEWTECPGLQGCPAPTHNCPGCGPLDGTYPGGCMLAPIDNSDNLQAFPYSCLISGNAGVVIGTVVVGSIFNLVFYTCCCRFVFRDDNWDSGID